jgi:hypothetical protein
LFGHEEGFGHAALADGPRTSTASAMTPRSPSTLTTSLLWLEARYLSEKERLMQLICVRHGARNITVGELNRKVTAAVAEAGSMGAAIESMQPPPNESRPAAYEAAHEGADDGI